MKIKFFFLAAFAAGMLATSCKNDALVEDNAPATEQPGWNEKGTGYVRLNIGLPTDKSTRANDDLSDGSADEYRVEDILLVLFGTTSDSQTEDEATLRSAYNLSDQRNMFNTVGTTTDQITSSAGNLVAEIQRSTLTEGGNMYAFVILNDHQFYEVKSGSLYANKGGDVAAALADNAQKDLTGITFANFKQLLLDESGREYDKASFFMSNAPVVSDNANYWQGTPSTLVKFDASKIKPTYDEAKNDPAATINVERALAKVECTWGTITKLESNAAISATILAWDLDNVNTVCYNTRNYSATWNGYFNPSTTLTSQQYRFISPNKIAIADPHDANTTVHRTYWGIDPNYNGETTYPLVTIAGEGGNDTEPNHLTTKRGNGAFYYCPENTFNVEHQSVENTTRLVVAAQLNDGNPFYTLLEKNASVIYQNDGGVNSIQQYIISAIANRVNVRNWAKKYVAAAVGEDATWAAGLFQVTLANKTTSNAADAGEHIATISVKSDAAISLFQGADDAAKTANKTAAIAEFNADLKSLSNNYLANEYHYYYYPGGVSYYQALIKHFGDDLTPWSRTNDMTNVTIGANSIYGADEATAAPNFLGRYGIVRNNWYRLTIQKINYVGSSTIPAVDNTPDDNVDNYISVRINILPWALRPQQVVL